MDESRKAMRFKTYYPITFCGEIFVILKTLNRARARVVTSISIVVIRLKHNVISFLYSVYQVI